MSRKARCGVIRDVNDGLGCMEGYQAFNFQWLLLFAGPYNAGMSRGEDKVKWQGRFQFSARALLLVTLLAGTFLAGRRSVQLQLEKQQRDALENVLLKLREVRTIPPGFNSPDEVKKLVEELDTRRTESTQ